MLHLAIKDNKVTTGEPPTMCHWSSLNNFTNFLRGSSVPFTQKMLQWIGCLLDEMLRIGISSTSSNLLNSWAKPATKSTLNWGLFSTLQPSVPAFRWNCRLIWSHLKWKDKINFCMKIANFRFKKMKSPFRNEIIVQMMF